MITRVTVNPVEIKTALHNNISKALYALYPSDFTPLIYSRWMHTVEPQDMLPRLTQSKGIFSGKVHCWMFGVEGIDKERKDIKDGKASYLKNSGPDRLVTYKYGVWVHRSYNSGDPENPSSTCSEDELVREIEFVSVKLSENENLGLNKHDPATGIHKNKIIGCSDLVFPSIDVYPYGKTLLNVAKGSIEVSFWKTIN